MLLHGYKDYEEYAASQTKANVRKLHMSWVDISTLRHAVKYILNYNPEPSFGLCHGSRRGAEQQQFIDDFSKYGKTVSVIGTEISHTAKKFPNTIQWDFHDVKEEWLQSVDFIYSNSLDHSYEPEKALDAWMSCLKKKVGLCVIEWGIQHGMEWSFYSGREESKGHPSEGVADAFIANLSEYTEMIEKKYNILDVVDVKGEKRTSQFIYITEKEELR